MQTVIASIVDELSRAIQGKREQILLALATFVAKGHLLLEDIPGVGKTTLAKSFAQVLGIPFKRIQFTSDLMPSDIIGFTYYDQKEHAFVFKQGPLFSSLILADEINRASPKTQSALLEVMQENQISVDGQTHRCDELFFVIATKNPEQEHGVFEMPRSELDRFMSSISLGYPDAAFEQQILFEKQQLNTLEAKATQAQLLELRIQANAVEISQELRQTVVQIISNSRQSDLFKYGLSTRGALALVQMTKAYALVNGRTYVVGDDILSVLHSTTYHRLEPREKQVHSRAYMAELTRGIEFI